MRCLGVLREAQNSPNRETDDALILKSVLAELERAGVETSLIAPEDLDETDMESWDAVLPMCETYPRLKRLESASAALPSLFINPPAAVLSCYRVRMIPLLKRRLRSLFPPSEVRSVEDGPGEPPAFLPSEGWWIKRGDVHNTCDRDVVRVDDWRRAGKVLRDFGAREVTHYVVQPHVPGDLVKFYGVGPGRWFTWFYHDASRSRFLPFSRARLAAAAARAAKAVGLEVFGGDAIVSAGGALSVIDINSWPSFAKVRREAASRIAAHVLRRLAVAPAGAEGPGARVRSRRPA